MAHECEACGQVCYCDIDDIMFDLVVPPEHCPHWKCLLEEDEMDVDDYGN